MDGQRVKRTVVQVAASVLGFVTVAVAVFPVVAPQVVDALEPVLPESWYVWLLGAVAAVSAVAGAITRIMQIPIVDAWLDSLGLGQDPKQRAH